MKCFSTDNFLLNEFNFDNIEHLLLLEKVIHSSDSELISKDIRNYISRNSELNKKDHITNTFVVEKDNLMIGLAFLNYHPEESRVNELLKEEIEIGLGLLDEFRGSGFGSLFENEFSNLLLNIYPQFNEVIARIDNNNIKSIKSAEKAGFIHKKNDEYIFKRK